MFAIALEKKQYKTYCLLDHHYQSRLEVVPERGGMITRWQVKGKELLYLDTERFANSNLTVRGGIPILFPICGNLPEDAYLYNGRRYTLKQHGFARDLPWTVTNQVATDYAAITLTLTSNGETREVYPFDFELEFTYKLKGSDLIIFQRFTNLSGTMEGLPPQVMPFSTGLHPYFWVSDKSKLLFEIPAMQYRDQITQKLHDFTGHFDPNVDEIDGIFGPLTGLAATATDLSRNLRILVGYHSAYSNLVFWTVKGKNYYCLEPWTAPRNALNTGKLLTYLPPGATCEMLVHLNATFF
ncbi:aldose epimerase [Capilliphycus salinus ALCB114379]|uniref:aldose epimerase family protein n=1 Tax=Capilliphycus salinus TaxID=2768948 RepID=UPI0039A54B76